MVSQKKFPFESSNVNVLKFLIKGPKGYKVLEIDLDKKYDKLTINGLAGIHGS
jgi:hypothetical protein